MNFNLHFGELHSDSSINDKNTLFENYPSECYKVKIILISFNCFSECITYINSSIVTQFYQKLKRLFMKMKVELHQSIILFKS